MSPHKAALLVCFLGTVVTVGLALLKIHGIIKIGWFLVLVPLWAPVSTCLVAYAILLGMVWLIMNSIK